VLDQWDAVTWKAGGSAAIYARDGRASATATRVRVLFRRLADMPESHIAAVVEGEDVEREGGFPGAVVVLQAAPGATFSERFDAPMVAPSKYRGMHGHAPSTPEMGATFLLWGDGVRRADLGEVPMVDVAPTLGALLGLPLPGAEGRPLTAALALR
jgi:hypothetical protein